MKFSSCQTAVWYGDAQRSRRRRHGSIDGLDSQCESRRGKFCVGDSHLRGSRSNTICRRQCRLNFDRQQCRCFFSQADEHLRGHPEVVDWHLCRSYPHPLACHISYGLMRPNLSAAGSVGVCLDDIAIFSYACMMRACRDMDAGGSTSTCTGVHTHFLVASGFKVT